MSIKKWFSFILITALLLIHLPTASAGVQYFYDGAYHEYTGNIFNLKVNDQLLSPAMPPIVFSDYSVVPARAVFQDGLGATVVWDGTHQRVTVHLEDTTIVMTINKTIAFVNGQSIAMPIAPKIINDYTMIPARFVGEALGMDVEFDSATDTVIINEKKPQAVSVSKVSYQKRSNTRGLVTIYTEEQDPGYSAFILENPMRLVVDVLYGVYDEIPSVITPNAGNITQIRFGQQDGAARVVVDLTENLGYSVSVSGRNILVSIALDPYAEITDEPEKPSESPSPTPSAEPEPDTIFKQIIYGYEGGRDYIRFKDLKMGTPVKKGTQVTIPIYGELPEEAAEQAVVGYFGKKMTYTPGTDGESGTVILTLKSSEAEMYVQNNEVRLKSVHKALSRSVTLDAGHGGQDSGAVAYNEDGTIKAMEKDFNLDVALRTQALLEAAGVEVHMIRTEDVYVDFLRVGGISNDAGTTLFVSVHTNSTISEPPNGIETYGFLQAGSVVNDMTSQRLSEILLEELIDETGATKRGVKDGKNLAVINSTQMPATLVEIGFISNTEECEKLMTEAYRQQLAQAIFNGVMKAFEEMNI